MIRIVSCTNPSQAASLLNRESGETQNVDEAVAIILDDVKKHGDKALFECTERYDNVTLTSLEVTEPEIDEAISIVGCEFLQILKRAKANISMFHKKQKQTGFVIADQPGIVLGQKVTPLDRAGIYVPGGTAAYPSSVLMAAIPARIAGVGEIVMVTPPMTDGKVNPAILAAAKIAGISKIFKLGGAQAVAALAFGTESVPKVDKIVGPGNIYVATAKRMVYGIVNIDMIAGPSDILIIADKTASPAYVAADLLSQAEHDRLAASFLVTTSKDLAGQVQAEVEKKLAALPRREIAAHSINANGMIFVTDTLENAVAISNEIAPEHLEVCVEEPFTLLSQIKHAGSIFLGNYAPEALGDYYAGPNHTLPTNGTARFSSPLSVDDFIKKSSFIYYDKAALESVYRDIDTFARREGLDAHADSVSIRFER